jgi:hypothetical protein
MVIEAFRIELFDRCGGRLRVCCRESEELRRCGLSTEMQIVVTTNQICFRQHGIGRTGLKRSGSVRISVAVTENQSSFENDSLLDLATKHHSIGRRPHFLLLILKKTDKHSRQKLHYFSLPPRHSPLVAMAEEHSHITQAGNHGDVLKHVVLRAAIKCAQVSLSESISLWKIP